MVAFTALNMAREQAVCVRPDDQQWQTAPQAPVRRWPLEREAPESGQVTSLVEYLPGARFPAHLHPKGEEILVLSGVFSDDSGDYPVGSYLRSPAGSRHAPYSAAGCLLFVKLNQFAATDLQTLRLLPEQLCWQATSPVQRQSLLHAHAQEQTPLLECDSGVRLGVPSQASGELLVLHGSLSEQDGSGAAQPLVQYSWLRDRALGQRIFCASEPSLVLLKLGALRF
ncbi:cupin domain-containing protein [Halopseudomonas sp.]|uniref:cupin domain-containing protein n=1 Tax=Halopseudomonas sp. TaxID=2901191 RepID=UPI003001C9FD